MQARFRPQCPGALDAAHGVIPDRQLVDARSGMPSGLQVVDDLAQINVGL